jgi:hypothetical protein
MTIVSEKGKENDSIAAYWLKRLAEAQDMGE